MLITQAYFSPGGTTRAITEYFTSRLLPGGRINSVDLLRARGETDLNLGPEDLLVINLPVFAGRLPQINTPAAADFKGADTPVVAMVTYGNREYEDALLELCDILNAGGFKVIAAGAFVARHSIFPQLAAGRPDAADKQKIAGFAALCADKLAKGGEALLLNMPIKGNRPYCEIQASPLKPAGDEACTSCGLCAALCPMRAIDPAAPTQTIAERCIACAACIYNCPQGSRAFRGEAFAERAAMFTAKFSARQEPEIFI